MVATAAMVCSVGMPAFAAEENTTVVLSEYEYISELAQESTEQLSEEGYSAEMIEQIKDYKAVYVEHINGLMELDDNTLENLGYSAEQIETIRTFDGSEEQMASLSAQLNLTASCENFRYDGNLTRGRLNYSWSWAGVPGFKTQDMVAVSWNDWYVENDMGWVDYYAQNTGAYHTSTFPEYTNDGNGMTGAGHKIDMTMDDNYYYAKQGHGYFDVRSDVHAQKDFYYHIEYGHSELWPTISFSVSLKGGFDGSISFSSRVNPVAKKTGNYLF